MINKSPRANLHHFPVLNFISMSLFKRLAEREPRSGHLHVHAWKTITWTNNWRKNCPQLMVGRSIIIAGSPSSLSVILSPSQTTCTLHTPPDVLWDGYKMVDKWCETTFKFHYNLYTVIRVLVIEIVITVKIQSRKTQMNFDS